MAQNRLAAAASHRFSGAAIDRSRPLSFLLNGRLVEGFAGDTILSATLASGVIGAGQQDGVPLALDEGFAPPVMPWDSTLETARAWPMERTPAPNGASLVTIGAGVKRRRLLPGWPRRPRPDLGLVVERRGAAFTPWLDLAPAETIAAELIVIGGGLAGLGAALSAGRWGDQVVLVERATVLGGMAHYFGSAGDEPPIDTTLDGLVAELRTMRNVRVLLSTEAFAIAGEAVRVHRVDTEGELPAARVLELRAPRIVLATGLAERLPVFAGNRLPGVVAAAAAFARAHRFGVWIGRQALLATATSTAYRVAMNAKEAGVAVDRVVDTRIDPQSRFIEFSKAHGIPFARGLRPAAATVGLRGGVRVTFEPTYDGPDVLRQTFETEQLVVTGGFTPDLALWRMAGGSSRWNPATAQFEATGEVPGVRLVGAAGGVHSVTACVKSGEAAVAKLFRRVEKPFDDPRIDPIHETPDDPTPIAKPSTTREAAPAFLDFGPGLVTRPESAPQRRGLFGRTVPEADVFGDGRRLALGDLAASAQLGLLPADEVDAVATERTIAPGRIVALADAPTAPPAEAAQTAAPESALPEPPAYLARRLGANARIRLVESGDGQAFGIGCLVYPSADRIEPALALGVIFAPAPPGRTGGLALVGASVPNGARMVVRDGASLVSSNVRDPAPPPPAPAAPAEEPAPPASPILSVPVAEPVPAVAVIAVPAADVVDAQPAAPVEAAPTAEEPPAAVAPAAAPASDTPRAPIQEDTPAAAEPVPPPVEAPQPEPLLARPASDADAAAHIEGRPSSYADDLGFAPEEATGDRRG